MTAHPPFRVADHWCLEAKEGRPVRSSGRLVAASGVAVAAVCQGVAAEATEVSRRDFKGVFFFFLEHLGRV